MNSVDTLYYNDKPVAFYTDGNNIPANLIQAGFGPAEPTMTDFNHIFAKLEDANTPGLSWLLPDGTQLQDVLQKHFPVLIAGGGLVSNSTGDILMIHRRGRWDLPKGKLDDGETIEQCAIREVEEETGISQLTLKEHLCDTWHLYEEKGKKLVKHAVWYKMLCTDTRQLVPQTEEDITKAEWVAPPALDKYLNNTYPTIADVFRKAGYEW